MNCAWILHEFCMEADGMCMDFALMLHEFYIDFSMDFVWICMEFAWNVHGLCMNYAGLCSGVSKP